MKPKILIVTPGFYPAKTYGGPVTSIYNLTATLHAECDFYIVTSNHELKNTAPLSGISDGWNVFDFYKIMYLTDGEMSFKKFKNIIKEVDPDTIYLNAPYHRKTTPKLLYLAKKNKTKVVLATRGGLNPNAINYGKVKKELYLKGISILFCNNTVLQSTSQEETDAIRRRFNKVKIVQIPNMPKPPIFDNIAKKSPKTVGKIRLVYISRILPIKNLLFALNALKSVQSKVVFDIYGPIESEEYWDKCRLVIENELPKNVIVNYCGYLEKDRIHEVYSKYDLFILPTESENFGHAIAEALYEKCPVLISDNTPWTDINTYGVGKAISLDKIDEFVQYIEKIANMSEIELRELNDKIPDFLLNHFNYADISKQYIELFS